jgi:hypothetical protein
VLRGDTEQFGNEERLTDGIVFGQPSHSSFPTHMDCFDACNVRSLPGYFI